MDWKLNVNFHFSSAPYLLEIIFVEEIKISRLVELQMEAKFLFEKRIESLCKLKMISCEKGRIEISDCLESSSSPFPVTSPVIGKTNS